MVTCVALCLYDLHKLCNRCVYELYLGLVQDSERSYCMYTPYSHTLDGKPRDAVGLLEGLAVTDRSPEVKASREVHFPLETLDAGINFLITKAEASREEDKSNILAEIGDKAEELDRSVHAAIAAQALALALQTGDHERRDQYLDAIKLAGGVRKISVSPYDSLKGVGGGGDSAESFTKLFGALQGSVCESLSFKSGAMVSMPDSIGGVKGLTQLFCPNCTNLKSLPDPIGNLDALTKLVIGFCDLRALPDSLGNLKSLTMLQVQGNKLEYLPETIGQLSALTELDLCFNRYISGFPESFANLQSLSRLQLAGLPLLTIIPASFKQLKALRTLDVSDCGLTTMPELPSLEFLGLGRNSKLKFQNRDDAHAESGSAMQAAAKARAEETQLAAEVKAMVVLTLERAAQETSTKGQRELTSWAYEVVELMEGVAGSEASSEGLDCEAMDASSERALDAKQMLGYYLRAEGKEEEAKAVEELLIKLEKATWAKVQANSQESLLETLTLDQWFDLKALPAWLAKHSSLTDLQFGTCSGLASVDMITHFPKLKRLNLTKCTSLQLLPADLGVLVSLVILDLGHCSLKELPESLGNLISLAELNLRGCKYLKAMPETTGQLRALASLNLAYSGVLELPTLPVVMSQLQALKLLDLSCDDKAKVQSLEFCKPVNEMVELQVTTDSANDRFCY